AAPADVPPQFKAAPRDVEGEPRVDSRELAEDWGVQHESLQKLAKRHRAQLESFGHLRFETGDGVARPQGGGAQEKFYLLNEGQTLFLLSLSRPTPRTVALRRELVQRFLDYRGRLQKLAGAAQSAGSAPEQVLALRGEGGQVLAALQSETPMLALLQEMRAMRG